MAITVTIYIGRYCMDNNLYIKFYPIALPQFCIASWITS